ncbi:Hypothetical predicted protein [Pelobates cultripes]|uniref:Uncharacterized protein n=1 Tax=Pelobates cultripes TaxID=61616 RepID=A0AAD1RGF6_PELCU|nr:Hypothetical predicted protein [Pelobates cultripes]
MSQHKTKRSSAKAEKLKAAQASTTNGGDESEDSNFMPDLETRAKLDQITKMDLIEALDALSNKLISTWRHTVDSLRNDIQELGKRTSHMEAKCDEFATADNNLATNVEQMAAKLEYMESKMGDFEDRARSNNIRMRGVAEIVTTADLPA